MALLRRDQILVSSVKEKGQEFALPKFGGGVPAKDLAIFTRQFSVMIDAGLPLVQCLEILGGQQENKTFAKVLQQTRMDVEGGASLADAMRKHPKAFDDLFTNMIAAGEAGGILDTILKRLATYIEKNVKLKAQVKGAMVYPVSVHRHRRHRHHGHPLEGHPHLRRDVRRPRRRAAAAHPLRDRAQPLARAAGAVPHHRRHPAGGRLPAVLRDPRRPPRRGQGGPQGPDLRDAHAEDRGGAVLPHPRHPDLLRRAHPRRPRDHRPHRRQRDHRGRDHVRAQGGGERPDPGPAAQGDGGLPARWSSR